MNGRYTLRYSRKLFPPPVNGPSLYYLHPVHPVLFNKAASFTVYEWENVISVQDFRVAWRCRFCFVVGAVTPCSLVDGYRRSEGHIVCVLTVIV
jgi:hypothetical protein